VRERRRVFKCQVTMSITLLSDEAKKTKIDKVTSWLSAAMPTRQKRGFKRLVELIAKGLDTSEFWFCSSRELLCFSPTASLSVYGEL